MTETFPTRSSNPGGSWVAPRSSFTRLKSGPFSGSVSTRWVRYNSGRVLFRCPICGLEFPTLDGCIHPWARDQAGFRYRFVAPPDTALLLEGETTNWK